MYSGTGVGDGEGVGEGVGVDVGAGVGVASSDVAEVADGCVVEGAVQLVKDESRVFLSLQAVPKTDETIIAISRSAGNMFLFI